MAFRALLTGLILAFSLLSPAQAAVPELRQPAWAELSLEQKQILSPLSRDWDKMEAYRKKKWLGIAKRYPTMKPEEQARVQRRMQDWGSLTPEQRTQARTQYKSLKTAPPEHKEAIKKKWYLYKELPDEEKKRLAEKAASKKASLKPGTAKPLGLAPRLPATASQSLPPAPAAESVPPPVTPAAESATPPAQADIPASAETPAPPVTATPAASAPTSGQQ